MSSAETANDNAEHAKRFDEAYARYVRELDDLTLFVYAQRSHASRQGFSRGTGWMKACDRDTATLMQLMGRMASVRRELLDVALAVMRTCNPHASRAEWCAKLFETARTVLAGNYDDVERRSGPESFRLSECVRPYTTAEKLIVLETLHSVCRDYIGMGWAAQRLSGELGCQHVIVSLTGREVAS